MSGATLGPQGVPYHTWLGSGDRSDTRCTGGRPFSVGKFVTIIGIGEMAEEPRTPSRVPPLLLAAIVCDVAVRDPSTGKENLIGVFDRVAVGRFPTSRAMSIYFRVTEASGFYPLKIDFVQADKERVIARLEGELTSDNPTRSHDSHFDFPPLPIPEPGRYEFRIFASDMYLGGASLTAEPRKQG